MFGFFSWLFGGSSKNKVSSVDTAQAQSENPLKDSRPYWDLDKFKQKFLNTISSTYNRTPVDSPTHGYYSNQVSALVRQRRIPFRRHELVSFLDSSERNVKYKDGKHVPFVYLAAKDLPTFFSKETIDNPRFRDNHFVSMALSNNRGQIELDYIDSNGSLMRKADQKAIQVVYPKVKFFYRDRNLNRIGEQEAVRRMRNDSSSLLRLQHDDYSCGAYASEVTRIMKLADDIPAKNLDEKIQNRHNFIGKGLGELQGLTSDQIRARQNIDLKLRQTTPTPSLVSSIQKAYLLQGYGTKQHNNKPLPSSHVARTQVVSSSQRTRI